MSDDHQSTRGYHGRPNKRQERKSIIEDFDFGEGDSHLWGWIAGAIVLALVLCFVFARPARSQEIRPLVICDTPEQINTVIELANEVTTDGAIAAVNSNAGEKVCAVGTIIFDKLERRFSTRNRGGAWAVHRVRVIGFRHPAFGNVGIDPPIDQFAAFRVEEQDS